VYLRWVELSQGAGMAVQQCDARCDVARYEVSTQLTQETVNWRIAGARVRGWSFVAGWLLYLSVEFPAAIGGCNHARMIAVEGAASQAEQLSWSTSNPAGAD